MAQKPRYGSAMMLNRRHFLSSVATVLGTAALADAPLTAPRPQARPAATLRRPPPPPPRDTLEELIAQANLGDGVSICLRDRADGAQILARQPDQPMLPASTTKSLTALYALDHLGAQHRFATRLLGTGPVVDGVLQGDLILAGGGDPVLDTDALDAMLGGLALNAITGAFHVWGGALPYEPEIEPGQMDHLSYNPSVSGLCLNFNRVHFEWRRAGGGYDITMDARSDRLRPEVALPQMRVIDRAMPIYTSEGPDHWTVARSALGAAGARWLPVRQPALYAGEVFQVLAQARGLHLPAAQKIAQLPGGTHDLARHDSPPLDQILRGMLEHSTNLTAEIVGLSATARALGQLPADIDASAARMTRWLSDRFGVDARFIDHSGLSDENRISPAAMVQVLSQNADQLRPLLKSVHVAGGPNYPGAVAAKTGTLNFVSALAGFITTADGRALSFAIMCANPERRAAGIASGVEPPPGSRAWNARAKMLQDALLRRWSLISRDQAPD